MAIGHVYITGEFINCTCNYSDGEEITTDKGDVVLIANNGYFFNEIFEYDKDSFTYETEIIEDGQKQLVYSPDSFDSGLKIYLSDNYKAIQKTPPTPTTPAKWSNIYKVDNSIMGALAKVRFYQGSQLIDYGNYIFNYYLSPIKLDDGLISPDETSILLGKLDSNVKAHYITSYLVNIDLGEIEIPYKYNNVYDFLDTDCVLHLPFFEPIKIENEYVIGQSLFINYALDLYSGLCTVNIKSSFTDSIIKSEHTTIIQQLPFIQYSNNNIQSKINTTYINVFSRAFIEVIRKKPYYTGLTFGKETVEETTLLNKTGFIKVNDINLIGCATNDEKDKIKSLLNSGVVIL